MEDKAENVLDAFLSKKEDKALEYIEKIEDMLNDYESFGWAEYTLADIYKFIKKTGMITDKQIKAVDNIYDSIYN